MMKKAVFIFIILIFIANYLFPKEAIIILGGYFGSKSKMKNVEKHFKEKYKEYDVFNIDYFTRKSLEESYNNMVSGLNKIEISKYDKVNFFCYIFGGKMLIKYLKETSIPNLGSIVFDRSPFEESLTTVVRNESGEKFLAKFAGQSILEYSFLNFDFPDNMKPAKIGLIIETKAIGLCYLYKKSIKKFKPSFLPKDLIQKCDDFFYIDNQHKQMYAKIKTYSDEVVLFFKTSKFSPELNRIDKGYLEKF
jgi:hypothetical protein